MSDFTQFARDIIIFISIIISLIYAIGFTRHSKAYTVFTSYLIYIAIIQVLLFIYSIKSLNSIFLFHFYFIGQFLFLSYFYYLLLKSKWVLALIRICSLILAYTYIDNPNIYREYHSFGAVLTHSLIVVFALVYYYRSLSEKSTFLYVNSAILIYFLSSSLYYASSNLVIKLGLPKETQRYIGLINDFLYLVFLVLIYIEWHKNYRKAISR